MQVHKFLQLITATFLQLGLMTGTARADIPLPEAQTFQVTARREDVQRATPPLRVFVTVGTNKFTFVTPDGFQVRDDPAQQRVIMVNADQTCTITFRINGAMPEGKSELDAKTCRDWVSNQHPDAQVLDEFSGNAGGRSGPGFNLQWNGSGRTARSAKVAFIPSAAGILEFSAVGSSAVQNGFNTVILTFQASDADGKLDIQTGSDQM